MGEHDQRFKVLLREFLPDFLRLFFPERAALFDLEQVEWLDKELFVDPPQGDVLLLDLVARLRLRSAERKSALALVHIEVESRDAVAAMPRRMFDYYVPLRRNHNCPVLPIAVYLRVGRDGIGVDTYTEEFGGLEVLRFQYLYVGLPALEAERYVAGASWLGVALAALMRVAPARKVWLRAEALRRVLVECRENDYRRLLLQECVEAYLQLNEEEQRYFDQLLHTEPYQEIEPMMITTYEKGIAKGLQEGREMGLQEGRREAARLLLVRKFGPLNEAVLARLAAWPAERLDELLLAVLDAPSLAALGLEEGNGEP
ncbi:MAG TPA: hypothetical protein VMG10_05315 [Gemmataceae bacterium]|nr:hypothetical protein [Gemmataceae bacterium]